MPTTPSRLSMRGICKAFGGVPVLSDVDLTLEAGEVVALLGSNGAGKSTLVKILTGLYSRDSGLVEVDGQSVVFGKPAEAIAAGVKLLPQKISIMPDMSIGENILLGDLPLKRGSGIALVLTGGLTRPLTIPGFNWIGNERLADIPIPLIIMVVTFFILWIVMTKTRFGRFIYASGGNAEAARLIGIPVERTVVTLYVVSALAGGLAGTIIGAMLGAAAPNAAGAQLLTVIAAIILGGTSLNGGGGSVWDTLLAVLILGTLNNGLTLLNVSSFWQDVTRGVVLMLVVSLDQLRNRALGE